MRANFGHIINLFSAFLPHLKNVGKKKEYLPFMLSTYGNIYTYMYILCVCIYIYINTYISIHIYTHMHAYIHISIIYIFIVHNM